MEIQLIKKPYLVSFTGNPMPFSFCIVPYSVNEQAQDIRLIIRVLVENSFGSDFFSEVKSQQFFPDSNGQVLIDISTIVDPYLEYYTPKLSLKRPVQAFSQRKRYKLQYLLQKDGLLVGTVENTDNFIAVKGGISYPEWHPSNFFRKMVITDKKPLHFFEEYERCFFDELKWLWWIYPFDDDKAQTVYIDILLNDGSALNYQLPKTVSGSLWGIYCCPIGLKTLAIDIPAGLYAIEYQVSVKTVDNISIVAPLTFSLDQRNFYDGKQLIYRNSLGGLETISVRGQIDFEADYSKQQAQRALPPSSYSNSILLAQVTDSSATESSKFKGDTGFLSYFVINKLRDLFLSTEKYEYNGKLYPISVSAKNVKFFTNRDQLYTLQIEWQRAYLDEYYTPEFYMTANQACPAMEKFSVSQINKALLQIIYACEDPYDQVQVEIITSAGTQTFYYTGNSRVIRQAFNNPITVGTEDIQVRCRTICDFDSDPQDFGPWTTVDLTIFANLPPVANDDTYNIPVGYNTPVTLSGSALANDFDPDGDPIEVVAVVGGATHDGGTYSINAAGIITYQPPSSAYTGSDYFDYDIREVGGAGTVSARVTINVGTVSGLLYAKIVPRNLVTGTSGFESTTTGEIWIDFFSDPAATTPVDVTAMGITFKVNEHKQEVNHDTGVETLTDTEILVPGVGTKVKFFENILDYTNVDPFYPFNQIYHLLHTLKPDAAYIII